MQDIDLRKLREDCTTFFIINHKQPKIIFGNKVAINRIQLKLPEDIKDTDGLVANVCGYKAELGDFEYGYKLVEDKEV